MDLTVESTVDGDGAVITLEGSLDIYTADLLRDDFEDAIADARWLVVDMSALTLIDSTGISVLLQLARPLAPRTTVLVDPTRRFRRLFRVIECDEPFLFTQSLKAARRLTGSPTARRAPDTIAGRGHPGRTAPDSPDRRV